MKIDVSEYEKKYTFELESVTQLCGQNIVKKTYIIESLKRYFSTYKYREEQNKWRNNVRVDNEIIGRKFFSLITVNGISEILSMIGWSKQSLMMEYVKQLIQTINCQKHLNIINNEIEDIFQIMNEDISQLGEIELSYAMSDVWDMVQKSHITGYNETTLEDKSNYELLLIFLNLIEEILKVNPKKMLVIIENVDHLISRKEYKEILKKLQKIGLNYDIYFVVSTSLDGYVVCDPILCHGISIFGDIDFQMPELDEVLNYIHYNYPYNKKLTEEQLQNDLEGIIHKIGQKEFLYSMEENVICKLINQSLMISEKWEDTPNVLEISFLEG